jgi:23S rRNA U2552 (ribose-2'-O)-methylase RlmE/FtsJ
MAYLLGSWMQVALQKIKCNKNRKSGIVIAVDLLGKTLVVMHVIFINLIVNYLIN